MNLSKILGALTAIAFLTGGASAQLIEGFDTDNATNWRMDFDGTYNGFSIPAIPATYNASGGNPGGCISFSSLAAQVDVWFLNSEFNTDLTGNFRAKQIEGATMDVKPISGMSPFGMHMNIVLADDMGTPELWDDILIWSPFDPGQYSFAGAGAAIPNGSWTTLTWPFDANSTTLPAGWTVWSFGGTHSGDDNADWNAVIQDVDYIAFTNGPPWGGFVLGTINIQFDNLGLEQGIPGVPFCFCDGSGTPSPCGNAGAAGNGCGNGSNSTGANLVAGGQASVSAGNLVMTATGGVPNATGLFFQGDIQLNGGNGLIFNDGLRCAANNIVRLQVVQLNGSGTAVSTVNVAAVGGVSSGDTRTYQYWYRDAAGSPCSGGSNTTNGLEILWGI